MSMEGAAIERAKSFASYGKLPVPDWYSRSILVSTCRALGLEVSGCKGVLQQRIYHAGRKLLREGNGNG